MTPTFKKNLAFLQKTENNALSYKIGLEKESLRVASCGSLSTKRHPNSLGSALTNSFITTDFGEAQIEFVTKPYDDITKTLSLLEDLHTFVYDNIQDEFLWASSMPCIIKDKKNIKIAKYGHSNQGKMKHIYRKGLALRYGKLMQTISGVHVNISLGFNFFTNFYKTQKRVDNLLDFTSGTYMATVRNMQRLGWIIPYLFGSSPAICKTFLKGSSTKLLQLDDTTYYRPYATSLRMGDIGYQNNLESKNGFKANYDNLDEYIKGLQKAINTPCEKYKKLSPIKNKKYQQLNTNILQIENEYYSTVRPKCTTGPLQSPSCALKKNGIEYLELRSCDIDPYNPCGISEEQLFFIVLWVYYCSLLESDFLSENCKKEIDDNEIKVAHEGRRSHLALQKNGQEIFLQDWGLQICKDLYPLAQILDKKNKTQSFIRSLRAQQDKFSDAQKTPSAKIIKTLKEEKLSFFDFAKQKSILYKQKFRNKKIKQKNLQKIQQSVVDSHLQFDKLQNSPQIPFDQFLKNYYQ
jgi:glutamate--cysteine ligase